MCVILCVYCTNAAACVLYSVSVDSLSKLCTYIHLPYMSVCLLYNSAYIYINVQQRVYLFKRWRSCTSRKYVKQISSLAYLRTRAQISTFTHYPTFHHILIIRTCDGSRDGFPELLTRLAAIEWNLKKKTHAHLPYILDTRTHTPSPSSHTHTYHTTGRLGGPNRVLRDSDRRPRRHGPGRACQSRGV